jgi:SAM-dependent methyltransferase
MTNIDRVNNILSTFLANDNVLVDRYDANYLDDFEEILKESYSIYSLYDDKLTDLRQEMGLPNSEEENSSNVRNLKDLSGLLVNFVNAELFAPDNTSEMHKRKHKYHLTKNWETNKDVKFDGSTDSLGKIIDMQVEYSSNQGGDNPQLWSTRGNIIWDRSLSEPGIQMPYGTFGEIKDNIISQYAENNEDVNMLCIGPRWVSEIDFLRERFGIPVYGLDLFSSSPDKIFIGDMHNIPMEDNSYSIVYQKNTYNKSYDIRKALSESVRILKPGGLLISDECLGYTIGVNELARTNIKTNAWYTRCLEMNNNLQEVVADVEYETVHSWITKTGLYAAIIKK